MFIVCYSDIKIKDVRNLVYKQVKNQFQTLDRAHIELARRYEVSIPPELEALHQTYISNDPVMHPSQEIKLPTFYKYEVIDDELLTIDQIINDKKWWSPKRVVCNQKEKEFGSVQDSTHNESVFVRFVCRDSS